MKKHKILYPRADDKLICQLSEIITDPNIIVGEYSFYHDFESPLDFQNKNVLYHYPINNEKLIIGKFCSIACGAKFIFNGSNHTFNSFSNYPFPVFNELWETDYNILDAWDNRGDIVIGNDVWIGYEAIIRAGVKIGNGAIIGTRSIVTKDVQPYEIVAGTPAKVIRKRFDQETIELLEKLKWWDKDFEEIKRLIPLIKSGDKEALKKHYKNTMTR